MALLRATGRKGWAGYGLPLLLLAVLVFPLASVDAQDAGLLSPENAWQRVQDDGLLVIDIRTQGEWEETGIPHQAALVSLYSDWGVPNIDFVTEVLEASGGDKERPIALICAGGVRSSFAADLLRDRGFMHVFDIGEGMLGSADGPGWIARGLPVEPCGACS
jgi:rhodanese-related sulfurtransferase